METLAYLASALIGISLGLIGGGGSILTIPVLVYMFGISPVMATSYSLFIVGSTSLVGAVNNYRKRFVCIKTALLFGLSSITTVFLTRKFIIPSIPAKLFTNGHFTLTEGMVTMMLFALLMAAAAAAMITNNNTITDTNCEKKISVWKLLLFGTGIGLATGLLGVGGGFLLIPALVLVVGLPMKEAIGTSLLIIALNSLIGFTGDLGHFYINWIFLIKVTTIAVTGLFIGGAINKKINGQKLKKGFGWFILVMATYIMIKELFFK